MMTKVAGIVDVHDLHVWNISSNVPVLTAHVHIGDGADPNAVLAALEKYVRTIGVKHSTIQICNPTGENGSNGGGNGGGSGHHGHSH
jgi:cobalt-zinc-cadmium efflux system protein